MGIKTPIYSKQKTSQRINLKTLLGYEPSEEQKDAFFEAVVEYQQNRTANGLDINGNRFANYSQSYADTKGVTVDSVDMILNGDMIQSYRDGQTQKNIINFELDPGESLKSFNHNTGDTVPKRQFFGVSENDSNIDTIVSRVDRLRSRPQEPTQEIDLSELRNEVSLIDILFDFTDDN